LLETISDAGKVEEVSMNRVAPLVLMSLLGIVGAAGAQILTGNIIGTVRDESGAVLPGVTVTLSSPAALPSGPLTVVANEKGEYRFTELAPGSYSLTATIEAFSTYQEDGLRVAVSGTTERVIMLKLATVAETITVSGESPMVDPRKVGVTTNLPREVIENIPTRNYGFAEYLKWTPGVAPQDPGGRDWGGSVLGSSESENTHLYEGINSNNPGSGSNQAGGNPTAVEEIQIVTLGASAEYQAAQGAVYNVVLKQGTNSFHFDGTGFFYPDSLVSKPVKRPCNCSLGETGYTVGKRNDVSASAGGPIFKDRLWFYADWIYTSRVEGNPGVDYRLPRRAWNSAYLVKVTWQINDRFKYKQLYNAKPFANPPFPTITRPYETLNKAIAINHMNAGELNATLSSNTLLTARVTSMIVPYSRNTPFTGDAVTPYRVDQATGVACCGTMSLTNSTLGRHGQTVKLNRYIQTSRTTHDVRFGLQLEQANSTSFGALPSGVNYSDLAGAPDQATFRSPYGSAAEYTALGLWAEDQMTFGNRLTVSLGVRFDRMHAVSPEIHGINNLLEETGGTIEGLGDMFTWNATAPRAGVNLKLAEDGKTVLRGHYGRAYRPVFNNDFQNVHPGLSSTTLARWNPATQGYTTIISVTDPRANIAVDPNLDPPFTDGYSVGLDRELIANLGVGATYVYKHGEKNVGWLDIGGVYGTRTEVLPDGRTLTVYPLLNATSARRFQRTNGPGTFTRYNGIVLTMQKRMANRWQASFSYAYGESRGRETTGQDPNDNINNDGRIGTDRPQLITATGSYQVPKINLQLAANFMAVSGTPFAPQALVQLPQGRRAINIEPAGKYRLPSQELLWIRVQKSLFRQGTRRLDVTAELANALQDTAHDAVATRTFFASNFAAPNNWVLPRRVLLMVSFAY
jgi:hypothetical protein